MIKLSSSFQNGPIKKLIEISKHEKEPIRRQLLMSIKKFITINHKVFSDLSSKS